MMTISDKTLSAFLDGELPEAEMQLVETALSTDSDLAERLAQFANADETLKAAFGSIVDEPIPDNILAMIDEHDTAQADADNVVAFKTPNTQRIASRWALPMAASLALVLGLTVGRGLGPTPEISNTDYAQLTGTIAPGNPIYDALENSPSSQSISLDGSDITINPVLTFKTADGSYCREFKAESTSSAMSGVACRGSETWDIILANRTEVSNQTTGYQTASGNDGAYINDLIDTMISGDPLGADEEQAVMEKSWQ